MKMPGEDILRAIGIIIVVAILLFIGFMIRKIMRDAVNFENVKGKLETTEQSADLGRQAEDKAGKILQGLNNESRKDREVANAARRPGATADDRDRLQQRAREAYAAGLCAEKRLQRESCEPGVPAAAGN